MRCVNCGAGDHIRCYDPGYMNEWSILFPNEARCECGSKDPSPTGHSDWCPAHKDGGKPPFNLKNYKQEV